MYLAGLIVFLLTADVAAADNSVDISSYADCLEQHVESGERLDPVTGNSSILAWVCAKETNSVRGVEFQACCQQSADLIYNTKTKINFFGFAQELAANAETILRAVEKPVDSFWAEFGMRPAHAASCAKAMVDYRHAAGFWSSLDASENLQRCKPKDLFSEAIQELDRLARLLRTSDASQGLVPEDG